MHDLINPDDNCVTVCVLAKAVGTQPNVRVIADHHSNTEVAALLRLIADDLERGVPKAQMDAQKN